MSYPNATPIIKPSTNKCCQTNANTNCLTYEMESITRDLRKYYFVDCANDEIRSISKATERLVKNYIEVLNEKSKMFKTRYILNVGSMAEETRVWRFEGLAAQFRKPVLEFDFLAMLDNVFYTDVRESCGGHMHVGKLGSKSGSLDPNETLEAFQSELEKSVLNLCQCSIGDFKEKISQPKGCRKCKIKDKNGYLTIAVDQEFVRTFENSCNLIFKWTSKARSIFVKDPIYPGLGARRLDSIYILVDLLPSYGLEQLNYHPSQRGKLYLVPKTCHSCEEHLCWRLSYSTEEKSIVRQANESHRNIYMTTKVFVNIAFPRSDVVSSYVLKTAFLKHLEDCTDKKAGIMDCLSNILDILSSSFEQKYMKSRFTPCNLLEKYLEQRDGFFQEWNASFGIMKQIIHMTDLLGQEDASMDAMHVYLRNTTTIYHTLMEKEEKLGDMYKFFYELRTKRDEVAEGIRSEYASSRNENVSINLTFEKHSFARNRSKRSEDFSGFHRIFRRRVRGSYETNESVISSTFLEIAVGNEGFYHSSCSSIPSIETRRTQIGDPAPSCLPRNKGYVKPDMPSRSTIRNIHAGGKSYRFATSTKLLRTELSKKKRVDLEYYETVASYCCTIL